MTTKPDGQFRKPSNNSKIKTYLPDFKFTPIQEGLAESISYFLNNYEKVRKGDYILSKQNIITFYHK